MGLHIAGAYAIPHTLVLTKDDYPTWDFLEIIDNSKVGFFPPEVPDRLAQTNALLRLNPKMGYRIGSWLWKLCRGKNREQDWLKIFS